MNLYLFLGIINILVAASGVSYAWINLIIGFYLLVLAFGGFGPFEEEKEENKDEE